MCVGADPSAMVEAPNGVDLERVSPLQLTGGFWGIVRVVNSHSGVPQGILCIF